jgi:ribonuclease BN (tRNA processing enzyme)
MTSTRSMEFEVLGFAGAAPLLGACSSYVVSSDQAIVLLDCGPGTLERLWRRRLLDGLDAIVVSHMHADHVLDLVPLAGEIVQSMLDGRRIALYVPDADALGRLDRAFAREDGRPSRYDVAFTVAEYRADSRLAIGDLDLSFAPTAHAQPCLAARITEGRTVIVYGADGGPSDALASLAAGADLLVLEATFADDEAAAAATGHMTAAQAGALAARAGARRLLLTHLLPQMSQADLVRGAGRAFDGPVELAREGYRYRR